MTGPTETVVEYSEVVPVFEGPLAEAVVVRGALEANGIAAFIRDENVKIAYPLVHGRERAERRGRLPRGPGRGGP